MVALEVGLPSLRRPLARSLPPPWLSARSLLPLPPASPPPPAPPARLPLAATRSPGSVAAPRSPEPAARADPTVRPAAGTEPPACEEGAAQAAAARRGGAPAGTRAGPGAGTPGSRSPGAGASEPASPEDREGGAQPELAELPTKCDAPAGLGHAAAGAARREDAPELRGAGRRGGAAPAGGGGGPELRPDRAPCPARADGPKPARSGRAGQVGGEQSPGTRVGAGPASRPTPELAHSRPLTGSLCVCKLPAGAAPGRAGPRPAHFVPARAGCGALTPCSRDTPPWALAARSCLGNRWGLRRGSGGRGPPEVGGGGGGWKGFPRPALPLESEPRPPPRLTAGNGV